tara:strand:- start:692 stop:1759 length:1068 start_codon:yes stop_codon:yes gene_type:complete
MDTHRSKMVIERIENLINKYETPDLQRLVDETHIQEMVNDQISEYNKYGCFSLLQSFTIAYNKNDKIGYLLDGQHRLVVYSRLKDNGYNIDINIPLIIYNVEKYEEVEEYFYKINKNSPIKPIGNIVQFDRDLAQLLLNTFTREYIHEIDGNKSCPNISYNMLLLNIKNRNFKEKLKPLNKSIKDVFNTIIKINNYLDSISEMQIGGEYGNKFKRCKEKSIKKNCNVCYLSIMKNFEWLDLALYTIINNLILTQKDICDFIKKIDNIKEKKREMPSPELRRKIWNKVNNDNNNGICYTCNKELQYDKKMHCGHIVAHALGGETSLDNMMPVCEDCNKKMGIMNMKEYKKMKSILK